jgi:GTP-binding protein
MVDKLEKFSAFRSMTALEECDVAALVIDAVEGATESDARVAGAAFELRKTDSYHRQQVGPHRK